MSTVNLNLWEVGGSPAAYLFSTTPKGNREGQQVWIPKSVIEHITRQPEKVGEWRQCIVKLPEWIAQKKGLL